MKVLGIDIGIKRTGLALSDEIGCSVRLLPNLVAHSRALAVEKILKLALAENVQIILIGLPEARSDYSKAVVSRVHGLEKELSELIAKNNYPMKVVLWDETYSSKTAATLLAQSGMKKKDRQLKLDAASARVLVEEYLNQLKK